VSEKDGYAAASGFRDDKKSRRHSAGLSRAGLLWWESSCVQSRRSVLCAR